MKSWFKGFLPERQLIQEHRFLRHFGSLLHDPNIWHLTRRSSAGGVATGLFCAFIPFPVHMFLSAALAILFRVNLPIAVIFTWVTNPLTVAPIFIFAYELGAILLGRSPRNITFEYSLDWLQEQLVVIWEPLLLGCFILATLSAAAGYTTIRFLWRLTMVRKWEERKNSRLLAKQREKPGS